MEAYRQLMASSKVPTGRNVLLLKKFHNCLICHERSLFQKWSLLTTAYFHLPWVKNFVTIISSSLMMVQLNDYLNRFKLWHHFHGCMFFLQIFSANSMSWLTRLTLSLWFQNEDVTKVLEKNSTCVDSEYMMKYCSVKRWRNCLTVLSYSFILMCRSQWAARFT